MTAQNGTQNGDLTARQGRVIAALLTQGTVAHAAIAARVGRRTIHTWLSSDPVFLAALRQAEGEAIDLAVRRLVKHADQAITVAVGIMNDPQNAPTVRLRGAALILDSLLRLRQIRDMEDRLKVLEDAITELGLQASPTASP